ncbi:MAG: hypothetical protein BWY04_00488 [candidate division CPR1 bacterium ADurb.Bin160]|uniref:Uncharacterized protein n=1 Tax=candidate division CPR1 bacterium ADurb.Bin160 TaxID=1852826 RepID=A0A1V5ZPV7_9BACT|nr:MAG: hypothetical protein BWY04_00488 [candidate division CPR1 bacterium ADurb.Bin160]
MPFKTFYSWLFDQNPNSKIDENILKYNSPITHIFLLKIFLRNYKLNLYLDEFLNNMSLRYIEKEDLLKFIKKCVVDYRISKKDIFYFKFRKTTKIFNVFRNKFPELKNYDIENLLEILEKNPEEKIIIFRTLGLETDFTKNKIRTKTQKNSIDKNPKTNSEEIISAIKFIEKNFNILKT